MRKMISAARRAVRDYASAQGVAKSTFDNTPLHYSAADLVSGLMLLAKKEGLNFDQILKDAKEVFSDEVKA